MAKKSKNTSKGSSKKPAKASKKAVKVVKSVQVDRLRTVRPKPKPSHFQFPKEGGDFKHIVRIANRDVPGYMSLSDGLILIYGIGKRTSRAVSDVFLQETKKEEQKIGNLTEEEILKIEDIILNLDKHVPSWLLNRPIQRTDPSSQQTMADLKLTERKELQRLGKIKSYRGLRLQWGLKVRGQKTKSSGRKHGIVGVTKKK